MKKIILLLSIFAASLNAATVTPGYLFTTNELVSHTKLNLLVSGATVGSIISADITDGTISGADIANNSITSNLVLNASLTGTKFIDRTLTTLLYATNSVDELALKTNIVLRAGTWDMSLSTITFGTVNSTIISAGAADTGKLPRLDASGKLDATVIPSSKVATNQTLAANLTLPAAQIWTNIFTYTTTLGSNTLVHAYAQGMGGGNSSTYIQIVGSDGKIVGSGTPNITTPVGMAHVEQNLLLVSNVTLTVQFSANSSAQTLFQHPIIGSSTITNGTLFTVTEIK